jgi:hypothetical protein
MAAIAQLKSLLANNDTSQLENKTNNKSTIRH